MQYASAQSNSFWQMRNICNAESRADYDQPFAEPLGIDYVIVNGVVTVAHGSFTENAPAGIALRR
jgi:hypothetical protein